MKAPRAMIQIPKANLKRTLLCLFVLSSTMGCGTSTEAGGGDVGNKPNVSHGSVTDSGANEPDDENGCGATANPADTDTASDQTDAGVDEDEEVDPGANADTPDPADADTGVGTDSFPWPGNYSGSTRLIGVSVVCEGALTMRIDDAGGFSGTGECSDPALGSFGTFETDFSGVFARTGEASGFVSLRSFSVDGRYEISGSVNEDGIRLAWFVDDIAIDGEFVSGPAFDD